MKGEIAPWTRRILGILEAGPRPRNELINNAIPLVPPGVAFRKAVESRARIRVARGQVSKIEEVGARENDFWVGARAIVVGSLRQLRARGRIIPFTHNGEVWLRLGRPAAPVQAGSVKARERAHKAMQSMTPEQRSEASRKALLTRQARGRHRDAKGRLTSFDA